MRLISQTTGNKTLEEFKQEVETHSGLSLWYICTIGFKVETPKRITYLYRNHKVIYRKDSKKYFALVNRYYKQPEKRNDADNNIYMLHFHPKFQYSDFFLYEAFETP